MNQNNVKQNYNIKKYDFFIIIIDKVIL